MTSSKKIEGTYSGKEHGTKITQSGELEPLVQDTCDSREITISCPNPCDKRTILVVIGSNKRTFIKDEHAHGEGSTYIGTADPSSSAYENADLLVASAKLHFNEECDKVHIIKSLAYTDKEDSEGNKVTVWITTHLKAYKDKKPCGCH